MSEHGLINLYHLARTSECDWHVKEGGGAHFSKPSVGITQALRGLMNYPLPIYLYTSQTVLLSTIASSLASLAGYRRTQQCNNRSHFFRDILDFAKKNVFSYSLGGFALWTPPHTPITSLPKPHYNSRA